MRIRPVVLFGSLTILLVVAITLATAIGVVQLPLGATFRVLLAQTLRLPLEVEDAHIAVIWSVRLPRVLVAGLVGFALAVSGAAMQGLFKNPLASPGIVGVSAGGSLGAVVAIFLGLPMIHAWSVPAFAFVGALIATILAYVMATRWGRTDAATLLLAGVAISTFFNAIISLLYHFVEDGVLRQIVYWLMGNLGGKRWEHVKMLAPIVLAGTLGLLACSNELNIMSGGEDDARSLGVSVERVKRVVLISVSLATGGAVSVSGAIGFVGLIVPHMMRLLVGPDHRWLLPASGLFGASVLILSDLVARTVFSPIELRTGIVTAFFGVPFFLYLLLRRRELVAWG